MSAIKDNEQRIMINDDYAIGMFDEHNFVLRKKRVVETGKTKGSVHWDSKAWCGSFTQIMEHMERHQIQDVVGDATRVLEAVKSMHESIERVAMEIKQLIKNNK